MSARHDYGKTRNQIDEGKGKDHTGIDTIVIINCSLNVPLMLMSILGNGLVLVAIIRTPSIRSNSMIMLCSLAVSDLFVGVTAQPLFIANELTEYNNVVVYHLSEMTVVLFCGISQGTITAITLDQFMALHYHMRYRTLVTKSRVQCTVVMIWSTIFVLPGFYLWNERAFFLLVAVLNVICLTISTFCYVRIYQIVRHHQLQINAQQQAVQNSNLGDNLNIMQLRRSAINTFVFYIVLILCYFPIYVLLTLYGTSYQNWKIEWNFAITVMFMNSSINPFLYCWRLRELRTEIVKIAKKILCTQTGQD
ncbi:melanocyte-stimulating hormone receptor-like [Oculina patagonica]